MTTDAIHAEDETNGVITRPIQLSLQITLDVTAETSLDELKRDVTQRLRTAFGETLLDSHQGIQFLSIRDPARRLCQSPQLDSVLTNFGIAAIVWCVQDVLEIRPDLTSEQASSVLDHIIAKHDASSGIGWDTLEYYAELLYGENPDTDEDFS